MDGSLAVGFSTTWTAEYDVVMSGMQVQHAEGDEKHALSMTILMTPDMSNFAGNVHGGLLLKFLDQVACTCATRYAANYAVTLSVDRVVFREAIHVGELVTFAASINYTGRTSMEVGIRVTTEDLRIGRLRHTNSCYFTMVAIGEDSRPVPVRPLVPTTPLQLRRHAAALTRKELRLEMDRRERALHAIPSPGSGSD